MPDDHIKKMKKLKKAMKEKIPELIEFVEKILKHPSVGLLDQGYLTQCRKVLGELTRLRIVLRSLDPEIAEDYQKIAQLTVYLIIDNRLNTIFQNHDDRTSLVKTEWANLIDFRKSVSLEVYQPELVQALLSPMPSFHHKM